MELSKKLQIPAGTSLFLVNAPKGLRLGAPLAKAESSSAVLVFASDSKELKALAKPAIEAAKADRVAWIAYPKAGQLGTDLGRDTLWQLMEPFGIGPVRAVVRRGTMALGRPELRRPGAANAGVPRQQRQAVGPGGEHRRHVVCVAFQATQARLRTRSIVAGVFGE
jgi:hypothetical protein